MGIVRKLRNDERALLTKLISGKPDSLCLLNFLENAVIEEMDDGGMGSLRFCISDSKSHHLGEQLIEKTFVDVDDVPIIVTVNLDDQGMLYELDIWKVDFSPLKQFPGYDE
jgi:hypothetical protein